jgi:lipoprotein-anchoring transpeptidase ErfK/SrfK
MLKNKSSFISLIIAASLLTAILISEGIGYFILAQKKAQWKKAVFSEVNMDDKAFQKLEKENTRLVKQIRKLAPKGIYIVVDTAKNALYLKKEDEIIRQAVISTGSGNVLAEPGGKRTWVFDTPRGEFSVKYKLKDPTWIKPDWAYIEEGEDIPKRFSERAEADVLGEYALGFGNGYFIHGTLYTRLLGRNVTHGCVRLGDEDLIAINKASAIGTKIYIF